VGRHLEHAAVRARGPRSGEFFAPLPLLAVALMLVNDHWLKPAFHDAITGKLSDVAVCFFMPLFVSEVLGIVCGVAPRARLLASAVFVALLYGGLEVVPPVTRLALRALALVGPALGIHRPFQMTSDWSDLACLVFVPLSVLYGQRRLAVGVAVPV
jgi:hypothetical protein